jgi:hypothetical protein
MEAEVDSAWGDFIGKVARRLAAHDWSGRPRSGDFVVFATDAEANDHAELAAELARSVPHDAIDQMRQRGLLEVAD